MAILIPETGHLSSNAKSEGETYQRDERFFENWPDQQDSEASA
jgi:hypothetical protein